MNVRWIVGAGGVIPMTTIKKIILLKRDKIDETIVKPFSANDALDYIVTHDFCNPHQLIRDARKLELRKDFFRRYFKQAEVFMVNTTGRPQQTQDEIRKVLRLA